MNSPSNGISPKMKHVSALSIPNSLRTIGPFLEEAQSIMRDTESGNKKVTIFCIDHALKLVGQFGLSIGEFDVHPSSTMEIFISWSFYDILLYIDEDAETLLKMFREKRDEIARELNIPELCIDGTSVEQYSEWWSTTSSIILLVHHHRYFQLHYSVYAQITIFIS